MLAMKQPCELSPQDDDENEAESKVRKEHQVMSDDDDNHDSQLLTLLFQADPYGTWANQQSLKRNWQGLSGVAFQTRTTQLQLRYSPNG
jgi:hypothetical protein